LYVEPILGSSKTVRLLFQLLTRLNAAGNEGLHVTSKTATHVRHTDLKPQYTSSIETDRMTVNEMQANDIQFLHLHSPRTFQLATDRLYSYANKF
jgi:predicted transcriptional regulator